MTKLIIRWTTTHYEEREDTENGETYKYPIYETHVLDFNVEDVLLIEHKWSSVEVALINSENVVIKGENITEYFR